MTDIFHCIIKRLTFIHCSCPCRNRYLICFHFTYLHAFFTLICGKIIFIQINMVNSPKKQGSCSSRRKDCPFMKEQEAWIILFFGMTKSCTLVRMEFKKVYKCPPEGSMSFSKIVPLCTQLRVHCWEVLNKSDQQVDRHHLACQFPSPLPLDFLFGGWTWRRLEGCSRTPWGSWSRMLRTYLMQWIQTPLTKLLKQFCPGRIIL